MWPIVLSFEDMNHKKTDFLELCVAKLRKSVSYCCMYLLSVNKLYVFVISKFSGLIL